VDSSPLAIASLGCGVIAVALIVDYLVVRPPLTRATKIWLFFALGVFPIGAAFFGNVKGYETTKARTFCGSCHVMVPHASDSDDRESTSLASRHARNRLFGDENCYVCHADYGMFGTVTTKLGGMRHVWRYYTEYRNTSLEEAKKTIHLIAPYPNTSCMQCHSTELELWNAVPDHKASVADVRAGKISCASGGCHGFAHPFTKSDEELRGAAQARGERASPPISDGGAAQTVRGDAGLARDRDGGAR
jgi:cytochrome c-type protein NapC